MADFRLDNDPPFKQGTDSISISIYSSGIMCHLIHFEMTEINTIHTLIITSIMIKDYR